MKRTLSIAAAGLWLSLLAPATGVQQQNGPAGQAFSQGAKILGYDIAPVSAPDTGRTADAAGADPTETGLGMYRGVVIGQFATGNPFGEIICDFGTAGVWAYGSSDWAQLSGVNPDWIIAATFGDTSDQELIGDFGAAGLWLWDYNGYPGDWTMLSGLNASWAFAVDDDNDGRDEIYVNFGATGLWQYDHDGPIWRQASGLNAYHGLRMDTFAFGYEEGCFLFPSAGVWRIYTSGTLFYINQLSGTVTTEDDHASASFTNGLAEDLVMDFAGLGLWLLTDQSQTDWRQISADSFDRIKTVKLDAGNVGLAMRSNTRSGLFYWNCTAGLPGTETRLNALSPDAFGFVEPFSGTWADGDEELAVDYGANGLWLYEQTGGAWTQLSGQNPEFMVADDYWGDGEDTCLVADMGAAGLWIYDGYFHYWTQISGVSPDNGTY